MRILPVFLPHRGCPFTCVYCDQHAIASPAPTEEALTEQLRAFCTGEARPRQVAFFGGTFTALPLDEQTRWLDVVAPWLPLLDGVRISTRPDSYDEPHLRWLRGRGVRTVELGVQSFADAELTATRRGYTGQQAEDGCRLVQRADLELGVQLMPGMPGHSAQGWRHTLDATLHLKPAFVRLYPLVVLRGTGLECWWREGSYTPLSLAEAAQLCAAAMDELEPAGIAVAKVGLHGDLAPQAVLAGPWHAAFGEEVRRHRLLRRLPRHLAEGERLVLSVRDTSLVHGEGGWLLQEMKKRLCRHKIPILFDSQQQAGTLWVEKVSSSTL